MRVSLLSLLALAIFSCSQAQPEKPLSPLNAGTQGYTYQVTTGVGQQLVYVSGQRPYNERGQLVGPGNLGAQAVQVYTNLQTALASVGMALADIRQVTYHLKGTPGVLNPVDSQLVVGIFTPYLAKATITLQEMKSLERIGRDEVLLEVEVIAVR